VPKFDSLVKHFRLRKCTMARKGIDVGKNFVNPPNQHIKNEKRYIHELRVNGCVTKGSYFQKNSN
jgi:hypothetical protein